MMLPLRPDAAIVLLTLGIGLIYIELNRPGTILPGTLGLLATLFATAALLSSGLQPIGLILIATATITLAFGLRHALPPIVPVAATLALICGLFTAVLTPSNGIHAATSLLSGLILGTTSARLAAIAARARRNKRLD